MVAETPRPGRERLSNLRSHEVINVKDGSRLGTLGSSELVIDPRTGRIVSLVVPDRRWVWRLFGLRREHTIPWRRVRKVGPDLILIDHDVEAVAEG